MDVTKLMAVNAVDIVLTIVIQRICTDHTMSPKKTVMQVTIPVRTVSYPKHRSS